MMLNATPSAQAPSVRQGRRAGCRARVSQVALIAALGLAGAAGFIGGASAQDVTLGAGDDTYPITDANAPQGRIDGGDGFDELIVDRTQALTLNLGSILNFEDHFKRGTGPLTLSGDGAGQQWSLESGTLIVAEGARLGGVFTGFGPRVTGVTLRNAGTIVADRRTFGGVAINGDDSLVSNTGSIIDGVLGVNGMYNTLANSGTVGRISVLGDRNTINNSGQIDNTGVCCPGLDVSGDLNLVANTGSVIADTVGVYVSGDTNDIVNTGRIHAVSGPAAEAGLIVEGDSNTILNSGSIAAGVSGGEARFVNGVEIDGNDNTLASQGRILAFGPNANGLEAAGGDNLIINSGSIAALGSESVGVNLVGVQVFRRRAAQMADFIGTLSNSGEIGGIGADSIGVRVGSFDGQAARIENLAGGVVRGETAIQGGDGDETIYNHGDAYGETFAFNLGAGDDQLTMFSGARYTGMIDGGDGVDLFRVAGAGDFALAMDDLVNFETLEKRGVGTLDLTGDGGDQQWFVYGGQVTIAEGATGGSFVGFAGEDELTIENLGRVERGVFLGRDDGVIINGGTIQVGGFGATAVGTSGDYNAVYNTGAIAADGERGVGIAMAGDFNTLDNSGEVSTQGEAYAVSVAVNGDANMIVNAGDIAAFNIALEIEGDGNSLDTTGSIILLGGGRGQSAVHVDGSRNLISNSGTIAAGYDEDGPMADVRNAVALDVEGAYATIYNFGTVSAAGDDAVAASVSGDNHTLNNTGHLVAVGAGATGLTLSAVTRVSDGESEAAGSIASVLNNDVIAAEGEGAAGIRVFSAQGQRNSISNRAGGVIAGTHTGIDGGDGSEVIYNQGSITGGAFSVDLGAGDDELRLFTGSTLTGLADGGDGTDTVSLTTVLGGQGVLDLDQIVNFELIDVLGGDWRFAGSGEFGLLTLGETATLGGVSSLNGDLRINGVLAPGNSIGTITVTGDVTLGGASTYQAEIAAGGQSDLLAVDGDITLEGGALVVEPLAGAYSVRTRYTVMTATGSVDGAFGSVTALGGFDPFVTIAANAVDLTLLRQVDFAETAASANGRAVAASLNAGLKPAMEQDLVDVMDGVLSLSAAGQGRALDDLAAEAYATAAQLDVRAHGLFDRAVTDSLRQNRTRSGAWLEAVGDSTRVATQIGARGLKSERQGLVAGFDWAARPGTRAGVSVAHIQSDTAGRDVGFDTDSTGVGAYLARRFGAYDASVQAAWMTHQSDAVRRLGLGAASRSASSSSDTTTTGLKTRLARGFDTVGLGGAVISPEATASYVRLEADGFAEAGAGAAGLAGEVDRVESLVTELGASVVWGSDTPDSGVDTRLRVAWAHEYMDEDATLVAAFQTDAPAFAATGVDFDRDALQLGLGVSGKLGSAMRVRFDYDASLSETASRETVRAGLELRF